MDGMGLEWGGSESSKMNSYSKSLFLLMFCLFLYVQPGQNSLDFVKRCDALVAHIKTFMGVCIVLKFRAGTCQLKPRGSIQAAVEA